MKVTIIHPSELGPAELDRWRALQATRPEWQNPFLAPEFTLAVGRARPGARVGVIEDGTRVVGFFPYEIRGKVIGKAIGAGISDCQAVLHEPGFDFDAMALIRACGMPVWEFDHLLADQRPFQPYHTEWEGSPLLDLRDGFETYLRQRRAATGGSIKAALRKQRKLAREWGELKFTYDASDPELLATLMRWKSSQYQRTGMMDRFEVSWIRQVVEELAATRAPGCAGVLSALYAGGRLIALDFGLRGGTVLVDWFPAYDREAGPYSPGLQLALLMAESAAAVGVHQIDLGKGQAEFKDTLKNAELMIATGRVERSRSVALVRRVHLRLVPTLRDTIRQLRTR